MKYNHAVSLNIEFDSDNEEPTGKEILKAFQNKIEAMKLEDEESLIENFEIFDTFTKYGTNYIP